MRFFGKAVQFDKVVGWPVKVQCSVSFKLKRK